MRERGAIKGLALAIVILAAGVLLVLGLVVMALTESGPR